MPSTLQPLRDRFLKLTNQAGPGDCWTWIGRIDARGYGQMRIAGGSFGAHRVSYALHVGPISPGLVVDHICHVRNCVNPDHLRLATVKQNAENRRGPEVRNLSSGVRGVTLHKDGKWQVCVKHNGRSVYGGLFVNLDEAALTASQLRARLFTHSDMDVSA